MTHAPDRRRWPCNGRVADRRLEGQVACDRFVDPVERHCSVPVTDLCAAPGGARDRQVLMGAPLRVLEERDGWAFVEAVNDGYTGYVRTGDIGQTPAPTHRVFAAATHLYPAPDFKQPALMLLSLGARLSVLNHDGAYAQTPQGFVPASHLKPLTTPDADPVAVAARLIGTPYLWGGNSREGIDCSGLVQIACDACGIACPGDSDMQAEELGRALPMDAALRRGDLLFWKGHVAWVADDTRILHANAHHMAVAFEDRAAAIARIAKSDGPVTMRRRLD